MVTKRFVLKWLFEYRVDLEAEHLADLIHENLIIHSIVGRGFRVESKTIRKVVGLCYDRGILDGYSGRYGNR
ncbi:hypothetical protein [Metallosphaera hakonensis]|nr:hypothetical protein [Metallosphaera hakonensis]AWR99167.2 hypothetical protein DFR87_05015 [Metallosphaera hakonensis JCM 8857 = DSM 7519]